MASLFIAGFRAYRQFSLEGEESSSALLTAREYWSGRGFIDWVDEADELSARRGSLLGNLTSFNMGKLLATLQIQVDSAGTLSAEMTINTFAQAITKYNRAYWALELATFESVVRTGDPLQDVWTQFESAARKGAAGWTLSAGANASMIDRQMALVLGEVGVQLEEVVPIGVK